MLFGILGASYNHAKEMLESFRFNGAYATISRIWQATQEFEDTHHRLPGKLRATTAACLLNPAPPCKNMATVAAESEAFWHDLDAAGLLKKYDLPAPEKTMAQGKAVYYIPAVFGDLVVTTNTAKDKPGSLVLVLALQQAIRGMAGLNDPQVQPMTPRDARGLDQMLDDALPARGAVHGYGTGDCFTPDAHYNQTLDEKVCGLIIDLPLPEKSTSEKSTSEKHSAAP